VFATRGKGRKEGKGKKEGRKGSPSSVAATLLFY